VVTARRVAVAPIAVATVAIGLGVWQILPGVGYWDTAEFQTVPPILGTAHPTGYPTYVILGWLASALLTPLGEPAFRMNLLSAILVGVAAGLTVDLVRLLTRSTLVGVAAGIGLVATPLAWSIATHADPHALHLAFVAALLWLLVRWEQARSADPDRADRWLVAAAAVTGLSIGNHSLTFLLGLPIALYVLGVEPGILRRQRLVALCTAALVIPMVLVYLELPLRGGAIAGLKAPLVYGRPDTLGGFVAIVTGEQFRGGINNPFADLPRKVADLASLAARQLGPLALLVVPGFIVTAIRFPAYALLTGSAMAITCFFNAAYVNAEIDRYYLGPALIVWTWLAVLAATVVDLVVGGSRAPPAGSRRRRLQVFSLAATALAGVLLISPTISTLPDRAAIIDRSQDRGAELWVDAVLAELEPRAIVVSWWSYSTSLRYAQQIQGRRLDVFVADDRTRLDLNLGEVTDVIDNNLGVRPVYVIRAGAGEISQLAERYMLVPLASSTAGNVFRVTARVSASADR
jgi:4-amino-4-deoxy-L-arabinose transferase-like glycosyltransferase